MNFLAIDIGNTSTKAGLFVGDSLRSILRLPTKSTEAGVRREILIQFQNQVEAVAIASVAPEIDSEFAEICEELFGIAPFFVTHKTAGISIAYAKPEQVGADRLCNAVQGISEFGAPLIIVDFGTATTLDVLSKNGEYLGGIIAPGIKTASANLAEKASKLDIISFEFPQNIIGKTTMESMQSGIMVGTVEMIDGMVERIWKELGAKTKVIATGGLANLIAAHSKKICVVDQEITLKGIRTIYLGHRKS